MNFLKRLSQPEPLLIDGAMGTQLFKRVPGFSGPLELLNIDKPGVIEAVHQDYLAAGAEVIETNTFGGSALKLSEYGMDRRCEEFNEKGASIALKAARAAGAFVAGSIGPTGKLIYPLGQLSSDEVYESFALQCRGLARGGVDFIIIETMNDLQEAKLAILAAKEHTSLPVLCSMTFDATGRTVTGTDMVTALASAAQFGADIVGANCSMGPEGLIKIYGESISRLKRLGVPLSAWANAGLPVHRGGEVYTMPPKEFAAHSMEFIEMGVHLIGGCCGTTPDHIRKLKALLKGGVRNKPIAGRRSLFITGRSASLDLENHNGLIVIGERLNPSARKAFAQELKEGKVTFLRNESKKQESEGAHLLDINVGVPGIDEIASMEKAVTILSSATTLPLMIDSDNGTVIERALFLYPGVPVVNSVNGKEKSIAALIPVIKRFGSFVVALCLDDTGIHRDAGKRIGIGERLIEALAAEGISQDRVFIDPLMLTESAEPGSAVETLRVIEHFAKKGIKTSIGLSNISFGLPERKHINNAFLKMAVSGGLYAAICNPSSVGSEPMKKIAPQFSSEEETAGDFLTGKDPGAKRYIERFGKAVQSAAAAVKKDADQSPLAVIHTMVVDGNVEEIEGAVKLALRTDPPEKIMNEALLKALDKVGALYSSGEYFLPQMIASATAMKHGFAILKPLLSMQAAESLGTVVICTVRGDIHDIGKSIVAMMLENHGFNVIDLGKDVPSETIIGKAEETGAAVICLSSLLTTTMGEMKIVSDAIRDRNLPAKLLIGGAVVNEEYARSIGALYGKDAIEGVKMAKLALGVKIIPYY